MWIVAHSPSRLPGVRVLIAFAADEQFLMMENSGGLGVLVDPGFNLATVVK